MKLVIELTQLNLYAQIADNTKVLVMLQVEVRVLIGMTDRNWTSQNTVRTVHLLSLQ